MSLSPTGETPRWRQRFENYGRALEQLEKFLVNPQLNEQEEQGLIKSFEYTYELGWNTLRDYLRHQGQADLHGSRDTIREAFSAGLIGEGQVWMDMLQDRNLTVHTYNRTTAQEIAGHIRGSYLAAFRKLKEQMGKLEKTKP